MDTLARDHTALCQRKTDTETSILMNNIYFSILKKLFIHISAYSTFLNGKSPTKPIKFKHKNTFYCESLFSYTPIKRLNEKNASQILTTRQSMDRISTTRVRYIYNHLGALKDKNVSAQINNTKLKSFELSFIKLYLVVHLISVFHANTALECIQG